MKNFIFIAIAFLSAFFVSCSDDSNFNGGDATVGFGDVGYSVKENKGLFTIPIVVDGNKNGLVEVTIAVETADGCTEDTHFLVTSKTIRIPGDKTTANVEIMTVDDHILNPTRSFNLVIVSAKGAKVASSLKSTEICLLDNDDSPYERMSTTWIATAFEEISQKEVSFETVLYTYDETEDEYGFEYVANPWPMYLYDGIDSYREVFEPSKTYFPIQFKFNNSTQRATLSIQLGSKIMEGLELGGAEEDLDGEVLDLTSCNVIAVTPAAGDSYQTTGVVTGTVSEDYRTVTFNQSLYGVVLDTNGRPFNYAFKFRQLKLTMKD